jgi:hypothetical protein
MDVAVRLVLAVLGGQVAGDRCEYHGCRRRGDLHRNGVWCKTHASKMESP